MAISLAASLLAAPAQAAGPARLGVGGYKIIERGPFPVAPHAVRGEAAYCPGGLAAIAGGLDSHGDGVVAFSSNPTDASGLGWTSAVRNTGNQPGSFTIYTICAGVEGYEIVSPEWVPVGPHSHEYFHSACPQGKQVMGGGQFAYPGVDYFVLASEPFGQHAWRSGIYNNSSEPISMVTYAVCGFVGGTHQFVGGGPATTILPGERAAVSATCPGLTRVLGGGAQTTDDSSILLSSYPVDGTVWVARYQSPVRRDYLLPGAVCG